MREYQAQIINFSRADVLRHQLSYLIVREGGVGLSRIDLWYQRDDGERVRAYSLSRMNLRD